jgi:hypothetical protein
VYKDTTLVIVRGDTKVNKETLKKRVSKLIVDFFDTKSQQLGQKIDLMKLTSDILSLESVKGIRTVNNKENTSFQGISFVSWNPVFEGVDELLVNQTITLPYFKFPYFYRPNALSNKIVILDE